MNQFGSTNSFLLLCFVYLPTFVKILWSVPTKTPNFYNFSTSAVKIDERALHIWKFGFLWTFVAVQIHFFCYVLFICPLLLRSYDQLLRKHQTSIFFQRRPSKTKNTVCVHLSFLKFWIFVDLCGNLNSFLLLCFHNLPNFVKILWYVFTQTPNFHISLTPARKNEKQDFCVSLAVVIHLFCYDLW